MPKRDKIISTRTEKIRTEFAVKIAKAMDKLKSSHVYFILQMAYGEELSWDDAQKLLDTVILGRERKCHLL